MLYTDDLLRENALDNVVKSVTIGGLTNYFSMILEDLEERDIIPEQGYEWK